MDGEGGKGGAENGKEKRKGKEGTETGKEKGRGRRGKNWEGEMRGKEGKKLEREGKGREINWEGEGKGISEFLKRFHHFLHNRFPSPIQPPCCLS